MTRSRTSDLNPALGRPGGPCQVVHRIEDAVRSPAIKEPLVDKVEEGEELSNQEAARVYRIESEQTRGLVNHISIGPHAQYRMDLRGVTVGDVRKAIEEIGKDFHAARNSGHPRRMDRYVDFVHGQRLDYVTSQGLKIVLAPERGGALLVTTFWKGRPDPKPPGQCDPMALRVAARYARLCTGPLA